MPACPQRDVCAYLLSANTSVHVHVLPPVILRRVLIRQHGQFFARLHGGGGGGLGHLGLPAACFDELAPGHVIELCGLEGAGKTELLLHAIAHCILPQQLGAQALPGRGCGVYLVSTDCRFPLARLAVVVQVGKCSPHGGCCLLALHLSLRTDAACLQTCGSASFVCVVLRDCSHVLVTGHVYVHVRVYANVLALYAYLCVNVLYACKSVRVCAYVCVLVCVCEFVCMRVYSNSRDLYMAGCARWAC